MDPQQPYTAVKSVVSIPRKAAEEAKENPKVAELKDKLSEAYPRLFSGVANKNPLDRGEDQAEAVPENLSSPGTPTPRRTSGSDEEALDGIY